MPTTSAITGGARLPKRARRSPALASLWTTPSRPTGGCATTAGQSFPTVCLSEGASVLGCLQETNRRSFLLQSRFALRYMKILYWANPEEAWVGCRHSPLQHYCYWNKWVANPIKKFGYVGRGRSAMRLLKTEILEKILLRRTKVQCADVLALPPRYLPSLASDFPSETTTCNTLDQLV